MTIPVSRAHRFPGLRPAALAAVGLVALLAAPCVSRAQVCGDVTGDDKVTATDAQKVLKAAVGQDVALVCTDQCAALETRIAALEELLAHVTIEGDNLVLTGMNFQVVSGSGTTEGTVNGTGNIILGYNETNNSKDKRTGSHNLVVGRYHSYSNYGGIVAGEDNVLSGKSASVLGGALNAATGDGSVVVAGEGNLTGGRSSAILAGEVNKTSALFCSVSSGGSNLCSGRSSAVSGGSSNTCSGQGSIVVGGSSDTLNSNLAIMAGSLGTHF